MMDKLDSCAIIGTTTAVIGTATQIDQIRSWISLAITIIGALMTFIPLFVKWWKKAKADGKITKDEIGEGIRLMSGFKDSVQQLVDNHKKKGDEKDDSTNNPRKD